MKIVINACFGGFSITKEVAGFMSERGNERAKRELEESKDRWYGYGHVDGMDGVYSREDPDLVAAVEHFKEKSGGTCAKLKVVEIPDGIEYTIEEYDGLEHIAEAHRTWS